MQLSTKELQRYLRQIMLPEIGLEGQQKLQQAKVLVVGAGGLGCPVLQYLAAAGVGTIGIVDDDVVDVTNLHRQILYTMADLGKHKATTAAEKLSLLNPYIQLHPITERLSADNAIKWIREYDLVIDGSDNFDTRYLVNDSCVQLDKPFVSGSILAFEGQVSVFNYQGGPTYRCLFPEPSEAASCTVNGVLGILPGIIGTYMANEALKIIGHIGETLSGKLMVVNALHNTTRVFNFERQPQVLPG